MSTNSAEAERPRAKEKTRKTRHQFLLDDATTRDLNFIEVETGAGSSTDAVRAAIRLTAWIVRLQKQGAKLAIVQGTQVEAIQLILSDSQFDKHDSAPRPVPDQPHGSAATGTI